MKMYYLDNQDRVKQYFLDNRDRIKKFQMENHDIIFARTKVYCNNKLRTDNSFRLIRKMRNRIR